MGGLENMRKRMLFDGNGGPTNDDRNVHNKYLSFKSALGNSYQAEDIIFNGVNWRCLINPDKLKEDYDQKEISIDFKSGMQNGSVFYWSRTDSYWLVFLRELSEEAYFRGSCRRCNYTINVNNREYHIYVKGPSQTNLEWAKKTLGEINSMNYILLLYITDDDNTREFFKRHAKVKFDGHSWNVSAVDRYTQDGIIEVYLEEAADNPLEDMIAETPVEVTPTDTSAPYIDGPSIVKPYDTKKTYTINGLTGGEFVVNSNKVKITKSDANSCTLEITTGKSGSFKIEYVVNNDVAADFDVTIKSL